MPDLPHVKVFISSPSDVMAEREIVERAIARLDGVWKGHVRVVAVRWEHEHYEAVRGFQESIGEMAAFDIVLGILWKRIGSPLRQERFHRQDGSAYESGTVFELESAIASSEKLGKPAVYLFRKAAPVTYTAETVDDERRQHQALEAWWNRTVRDEQGHFLRGYQEFTVLEEFESRLEDLLERHLRDKGLIPAGAAWDIASKGSPYPGLLPYNSSYSEVFFGRGLAIAAAMEDLRAAAKRETPFLLIVGPSGSGKSSLARAGLWPHFAGHQIEGVDNWRKLILEPAQDPFVVFAQHLYGSGAVPEMAESPQPTPEGFGLLARQAPESAAQAIKWGLQRASIAMRQQAGGGRVPVVRLLVVLDQMETVLDHARQRELSGFLRALVESGTTWVVATLRSDRYADFQLDPDLLELRRRGAMYDLPPPGPSEIADIIKGPARAADLEFEERDGVSLAKIINAAVSGADALPLLQMTLARLFDAREGRKLTFAAYQAMEGLEGAIAAHVEAVFDTVSPAGQATLDALLRSLVADIDEDGRLTIRTPDRAAVSGDAAARELVDKLTEGRLLVNDDAGVRVGHEALLRRWQRATASPALQPEAIRLRHQIEPTFEVWQRTRTDNDLLQPGTTVIAAAEAIVSNHPGAFPPDLEAYVRRSVEAAQARAQAEQTRALADARRARWRAYAATAAALAFGALALLAFVLFGKAQDNLGFALLTKAEQYLVEERPTQALVAAAAAEAKVLPAPLARLAASQAESAGDIRADTIAVIAGPASRTPFRTLTLPDGAEALAVAFNGDGSLFAVGDGRGRVTVAHRSRPGGEVYLHLNTQPIRSIKFSPDGRWLASASDERVVKLWNLKTNRVMALCGHRARLNDVAFDPGGRYLASASNDGHVIVWNAASFGKVADLDSAGNGEKSHRWALAVEFSHNGALLASSDDLGNVFIRKTSDWSLQRVIRTGRTDLISISFSPNDRLIATASIEGALDVWDVDSGLRVKSIVDHPNRLWRVRFSPDGRFLAAATWDGLVRLWDARPFVRGTADTATYPFAYAGTINGNDHWVNDIAFTHNGAVMATAGETGTVRLWDIRNMQPMFYSTRDERRETVVGRYSPDGTKFVAGGRDGFANLYDVNRRGYLKFRCTVKHAARVVSLAFSRDSKWVVSAGTVEGGTNNVIRIWNSNDCAPRQEIAVGNDFVEAVDFDPDSSKVAWSTLRGAVRMADLTGDGGITTFPHIHRGRVWALSFSPDGRLLLTAGEDDKVILWNVRTHTVYRKLRGPTKPVTGGAFGPRGRLLATAGEDDRVFVWDLRRASDSPIARLRVRGGASGLPIFGTDGRVLAVGADARFLSIWSLQSFRKLFELDALVGVRGAYGFDPVRGDLAFDGGDGVVRIIPRLLPRLLARTLVHPRRANAVIKGTDVYFDEVRRNVIHPREIRAAGIDTVGCTAESATAPN